VEGDEHRRSRRAPVDVEETREVGRGRGRDAGGELVDEGDGEKRPEQPRREPSDALGEVHAPRIRRGAALRTRLTIVMAASGGGR